MLRVVIMAAMLFAAPGGMAVASQLPSPDEAPNAPGAPKNDTEAAKPAPQAPGTVAGMYLCQGTNPDGSPYEGLVEIAAIEDTYLVHWMLADGGQVLGVGILRDGVLAVSYFGGTPAVAVYRVEGERLVGEWTMGGTEGMLYSETLTKMQVKPVQPDRRESPRQERPDPPSRARPIRGVTVI